jgi:hypothetical protein
MCEMNFVCVGEPRLGNVKITQLGRFSLFNEHKIKGGDDSAVLLNLPKEVISF